MKQVQRSKLRGGGAPVFSKSSRNKTRTKMPNFPPSPMPSPGVRFVRLAGNLFRRVPNPAMAFDSGGVPDSGRLTPETIADILKLLDGKISPDALAKLAQQLDPGWGAVDQPAPFPGRPTRGGEPVPLDPEGAVDGFSRRFPGASRIGVDNFGTRPERRGFSRGRR